MTAHMLSIALTLLSFISTTMMAIMTSHNVIYYNMYWLPFEMFKCNFS